MVRTQTLKKPVRRSYIVSAREVYGYDWHEIKDPFVDFGLGVGGGVNASLTPKDDSTCVASVSVTVTPFHLEAGASIVTHGDSSSSWPSGSTIQGLEDPRCVSN